MMKSKILMVIAMVMMASVSQAIERYYVVKLTDMIGTVGYEIMDDDQYKAAYKEIQEESRIFSSVISECKKEWRADATKEENFVSSKIKARKISKGSTYSKMEKAETKYDRMQEKVTEDRLEDLDKFAKQFKRMDERGLARESAKLAAFKESFEMVTKKMEEKLGRKVPNFGFNLVVPNPAAKH